MSNFRGLRTSGLYARYMIRDPRDYSRYAIRTLPIRPGLATPTPPANASNRFYIAGTQEPVLRSKKVDFDPSRGQVVTEEWEQAGGDMLADKARAARVAGHTISHHPSPAHSTLTIVYTGGTGDQADVAIDSWQLLGNEIQADIKRSPAAMALTLDVRKRINQDVRKHQKGDTVDESYYSDKTNARRLFLMLINGQSHMPISQYVLRHTTNVWEGYTQNISDVGVGMIYSTNDLIDEIGDSSLWVKPCPARLRSKIRSITPPAANSDLIWGWRKLPSTETTAANNRIDISTEYHLDHWPVLIYDQF